MKSLGEFARANLPAEFNLTIDLPSEPYRFPLHIFPTDMRSDMVWWSDEMKKLWMFELTISYETVVEDSCRRKQAKYQELVEAGQEAGYSTQLITLEVGSRGMVTDSDFELIRSTFKSSTKETVHLTLDIIRTVILQSFKIWCSRNNSIIT